MRTPSESIHLGWLLLLAMKREQTNHTLAGQKMHLESDGLSH